MKSLIVLCVVSMVTMAPIHKCTLDTLYRSIDIQLIVYQRLSEVFDVKFAGILEAAKDLSPYLINPAHYFKNQIKHKFIVKGGLLDSITDLVIILKQLNYLSIEKFRKEKLEYDRHH